ncbi:MAG TPA: methylmalonyl-CoA epimerase [Methylocella sp.]|nr:methylmalonyl-CoA epimerase [Methylocella sp.]
MIGRLTHIAIAVSSLDAAIDMYRKALGAAVSEPAVLPEHGVRMAFVEAPNTRIELIEPVGEGSPIARFLAAHPGGAIHHLCFAVKDIHAARGQLEKAGARILGDGKPKTGARGKPVLFLHPKDFAGALIELEEA